uniref:DNA polymerase epsilon subunit 4 n=1 Tax=Dromaius novaehollandiae TaxID=8790 RepID=A0A8C4JF85_DRONO
LCRGEFPAQAMPAVSRGPWPDTNCHVPALRTSVPLPPWEDAPARALVALVKADPDVSLASQEAVYILARAAELFVETIAKDAYVYAQQGKRKTLQRKDLDNAIEAIDEFAFLEGEFLLGLVWFQYFV